MLTAFLITTIYEKHIPEDMTNVVVLLAIVVVIGTITLIWVVKQKHHTHPAIRESKLGAVLRHVEEGLQLMGNRRTLMRTAAVSLVYLLLQYLTVYMLMRAYLLDYSFWVAAGVLT